MKVSRWSRCIGMAALIWVAGIYPAGAQNPAITLNVDNLELREIVKRLGETARAPLELFAPDDVTSQKASFHWEKVGLGQAMRDLCNRFALVAQHRPGAGYELRRFGGVAPNAGEDNAPRAITPEGYQVIAQRIQVYEGRARTFLGGGQDEQYGNLTIQILCRCPAGESLAAATLDNVQAEDDLGNRLTSPDGSGYYSGGVQFPDERIVSSQLPTPDPRATRLRWLTADLYAHRSVQEVRISIPLPLEKRIVVRQEQGVLVAVADWRSAEPIEGLPPELAGFGGDGGPSARVRVQWAAGQTVRARDRDDWLMAPVAVDASGRRYYPSVNGGSGGGGEVEWREGQVTFHGMQAPAVRLEWNLLLCSDLEKVTSLRLTDIPLPSPPKRPAPAPKPPVTAPAVRTGSLACQVLIDGKPATPGKLAVGMATRQGRGWGPIRWRDVWLSAGGAARLEDLAPGTYRVLRRYATPSGRQGRWQNADVVVTIITGKEARLPALEFKSQE
ncbi:MAG: hypothetical protein HY320_08420 [Armatimonadetes bacterium]|nr:hypothetical protein [Armatimonadota bacterium]